MTIDTVLDILFEVMVLIFFYIIPVITGIRHFIKWKKEDDVYNLLYAGLYMMVPLIRTGLRWLYWGS